MSPNAPSGGLSLFPNTSIGTRPPSRRTTPKPRTSQDRGSPLDMSPSRAGRRTPEPLSEFVIDGSPPQAGRSSDDSHMPPPPPPPPPTTNPYRVREASAATAAAGPSVPVSRAIPISDVPPRTDTALSGASTLVRSSSNRSRSSIAKRPLGLEHGFHSSSAAASPPPLPAYTTTTTTTTDDAASGGIRSMFPQYDPSRALDQQNYFPTQTSPRHIPRTVISRQSHYPAELDEEDDIINIQSQQQQSPQQQQYHHQQQQQARSPPPAVIARSPLQSANSANQRWPRWQPQQQQDPPAIPTVSRTDELRDYWKAANGWRASAAEGRTYSLRLARPARDTPVYTLTAAVPQTKPQHKHQKQAKPHQQHQQQHQQHQPLYHLRIDPTSASARVTLSRHNPGRTCKDRDPQAAAARAPGFLGALREAESHNNNHSGHSSSDSSLTSNSNSNSNSNKPWQEVLTTTLEPPTRRRGSGGENDGEEGADGLVALLYPSAAARVALDRPGDASAVAAAERECARLVWDEDSASYFLAHPALAAPFCVTVERNAAWSRAEYALEHVESPRHLARLITTRATGEGDEGGEGEGLGFFEIDTAVASRVEGSYYILDVAVAALMLVAHLEEEQGIGGVGPGVAGVEQFEPPPSMLQPPLPAHLREDGGGGAERESMGSRISGLLHGKSSPHNNITAPAAKKNKKNKKWKIGKPTDEFELDLESQSSNSLGSKFYPSPDSNGKASKKKMPGTTRTVLKLLSISFKCVIWALTLLFKALYKVVVGLSRCLTSEKL